MSERDWFSRVSRDISERADKLPSWFKDNHPAWRELREMESREEPDSKPLTITGDPSQVIEIAP